MKYIFKTIPLVLLTVIYFSYNCVGQPEIINNPEKGAWQDREPAPVTFELEQVFGSEFEEGNNAFFSRAKAIWSVNTDEEGNVYVLDIDLPMLAKFSPDGALLWKKDRRGRGPGDLENAYSMAVADSVYITNIQGARIDIYDKQGNFKSSFDTKRLGGDSYYLIEGVINNRYLVLKTEIVGGIGIEIAVLDIHDGFSLRSKFEVAEDPGVPLPAGSFIQSATSTVGEHIVVSKILCYCVQYYTIDGKLVKKINRDFPYLNEPGIYNPSHKRGLMFTVGRLFGQYMIQGDYLINSVYWGVDIENTDRLAQQIAEGDYDTDI